MRKRREPSRVPGMEPVRNTVDYVFYAFVFILLLPSIKGDCTYKGQRIRNDTVWAPDDCTICVCPKLPMRQEVKCTAVGECFRQNFIPDGFGDDRRGPDMQADQAPFTFSFLPSRADSISVPVVKETGITVTEGEKVTLSAADFLLRGANLAERKISFVVTETLPSGQGWLERVDKPREVLTEFTLDDLNAKRITYEAPTEKAIGMIPDEGGSIFSFTFNVIDRSQQRGDTSPEQKFYIRVLSSNIEGPQFPDKVRNITIKRGDNVPIPQEYFRVSDKDTALRDLTFRMTTSPKEGRLIDGSGQMDLQEGVDQPHDVFVNTPFRYAHDGRNLDNDQIVITVSDGKHSGTLTVNIFVVESDRNAPVLDGGTMNMQLPEGTTEPVTERIIKYKDNNSTDENVCFRLTKIPDQGILYRGDPREDIKKRLQPGDVFCQTDINNGHITYSAPDEIGPLPVPVFLVFDVSDANNNTLPDQSVTITITPVNNLPPVVQVFGPLEVIEGGRERIPPTMITVNDPDTPVNDLVFHIDSPPEFGTLENQKKPGQPVTSFPAQDFLTGNIVYINTPKPGEEPNKDRFHFHVTDGTNDTPDNIFNFTIIPANDEPPVVTTKILYVKQGGTEPVQNQTLYVTDLDTLPPDLVFTLSTPPAHGHVSIAPDPQRPGEGKRIEPGDTFTYQDVLKGLLHYTHDDTKTTEDNIDLSLTDGIHTVPANIEVRIQPDGNEGPYIVVNIGATVPKGQTVPIDRTVLQAKDDDSEIPKLKFTITEDVDHGKLLLLTVPGEPEVELRAGSPHNSFLQDDLDNGRLRYQHNIADPTTSPSFIFDLSDPEGNTLPNQNFRITVLEDRIPPEQLKNKGLTLPEKTHAPITNNELEYTDANSPPDRLKFTVLRPPNHGRLEKVDQPGVPITEFRQGDLDRGTILYNHTSDNKLPWDNFVFRVTDGTNERSDTFRITIIPRNDSAPTAIYTSLTVNQGDRGTVRPNELRGEDEDTEDRLLVFKIIEPPREGQLLLRREDGQEIHTASFTMQDIWRNRIIYHHDGGPSTKDSFKFILSDQTHQYFFVRDANGEKRGPLTDPETFPINIRPKINSPPTLVRNIPLPALRPDEQDNRPMEYITPENLQAKDPDTPDNELWYYIVTPPRHGQVENKDRPGQPITRFSQDDLNQNKIRYVLTDLDTPETSDFFIARLQDNGQPPNILDGIIFKINWSWLAFEQEEYTVQENVGVVRLVIRKTGNMNHYSLVQCSTTPGTATDAAGGDFQPTEEQIQFEEGVSQKTCAVTIRDDQQREGPEDFFVHLSKPLNALIRQPKKAKVIITDDEDMGGIQFDRPVYLTNERVRVLQVPLIRTGDTFSAASVACITRPGTARDPQDFAALRPNNRVTFGPGQDRATCDVQIVDDGIQEPEEEFELILQQPSPNANLGVLSRARVVIQGPNDGGATIRFAQHHCLVREVSGRYQFEVIREGSDLSQPASVTCTTEPLSPVSATPNEDYVHMSERVNFASGQRRAVCSVQIIDDSYFEGNESFYLILSQPQGATLGQPSKSTVTIFDTDSEVPTIQFERIDITVEETAGRVDLPMVRTGNVDVESTVRCFTMSRSAQPGNDYVDRPNTDHSIVTFRRGERRQMCTVVIVDDSVYETDEQFYVVLGSPQNSRLGAQDKIVVTLTNREDIPKVYFEQINYDVNEPDRAGSMSTVLLTVLRSGDTSRQSEVRVTTRDSTATAGLDYHSKSQMLVFKPGETAKRFAVEILYDNDREATETFTVHLGPDQPINAEISHNSVATVCIHDRPPEPMPILPSPPVVISLVFHENIQAGMEVPPSPGYPLLCLSPCDARHPRPQVVATCQDRFSYRWEMATDTDREGNRVYSSIADSTPFTSAQNQVLDSIYFAPNCILRCAVDQGGGQISYSAEVTISRQGACANPRTPETKGSQRTLTTDIQYNEPSAPQFPNTVHIQVTIPHRDGILPVISTFPIHNPKMLLTEESYRSQHVCSNLIPNQDNRIKGFLDATDANRVFPSRSGLLDTSIRGNMTVQLYQHLNMDTCQWSFDANYDMTTLVDKCGGTVNTNANSRAASNEFGQRAVTVTVPLYVTYIYAVPPSSWGSIDHRTTLEISFNYDTALSNDQVRTTNDNLDAKINVVRVRLTDQGSLCITIKTQTKFRGTFVLSHPRLAGQQSQLVAPSNLPVRFNLALEWQQETYDYPMQTWQATSDLSLRDFTGDYTLQLIPCMASRQNWSPDNVNCEPRQAKHFILPITFSQGNRPPPLVYSLNTDFQLSHGDQIFQADSVPPQPEQPQPINDNAFGKGESIHGCVMWNPVQDLKDAYKLEIQRLYVCCGKEGYTPTYEPRARLQGEPQYGCMQPSKNLRHRYLLLDRSDPRSIDRNVGNMDFQAEFLDKNPKLRSMKKRSGLDGFVFKTDPLYELGPGRQWYLQVLYVITTADESSRVRRAAMLPVKVQNGTNMRHIELRSDDFLSSPQSSGALSSLTTIIGASVGAVVLLLVAAMVAGCIVVKRRRSAWSGDGGRSSGGYRPGYQMQSRGTHGGTARVKSAPRGGYVLAKGTEV